MRIQAKLLRSQDCSSLLKKPRTWDVGVDEGLDGDDVLEGVVWTRR